MVAVLGSVTGNNNETKGFQFVESSTFPSLGRARVSEIFIRDNLQSTMLMLHEKNFDKSNNSNSYNISNTLLLTMTAPSIFVRVDDTATFSELISLNSIQRLTTVDDGQNIYTQVI